MLIQQQQIQFSPYSSLYDLIVPQDNLLRKINELIDFSFIYDELLNKYCTNNGRTSESPVHMFKYLLLKTIYDVFRYLSSLLVFIKSILWAHLYVPLFLESLETLIIKGLKIRVRDDTGLQENRILYIKKC